MTRRLKPCDADKTDAEVLVTARDRCQEIVERFLGAMRDGSDITGSFAATGKATVRRVVTAAEIREIGHIMLDAPGAPERLCRCWVYRGGADGELVYIIGWKQRLNLQTHGFVSLVGTMDDEESRN